jgi:hypothetical protein
LAWAIFCGRLRPVRAASSLPVVLLVLIVAWTTGACSSGSVGSFRSASVRQTLAHSLLKNPRVGLANFHVSGRRDNATAMDNMRQAERGAPSMRSAYQRAPGGSVYLDIQMLWGMHYLTKSGWSFRVTELAGGSHSKKSSHYRGVAFDVDYINGVKVGRGNRHLRGFMWKCRQLGAREVKGPGTPGHSSHVHVEW